MTSASYNRGASKQDYATPRELLVDGRCANESGECSGITAGLVPIYDVSEVLP
jgi:hypothetical protein